MVATQQELEREKFDLISSTITTPQDGSKQNTAQALAAEMSCVHNNILRGIESIYKQAVNVSERGTTQDKVDFANYGRAWIKFIQHHHELEEDVVFPDMARVTGEPGLMDGNIEEHKVFHDGLDELDSYLAQFLAEKVDFDGKKLVTIIDGFVPTLRRHLRNEIDTLLDLERFEDQVNWTTWFAEIFGKAIESSMQDFTYKTEVLPLAVILQDRTYEQGVWADKPGIPWLMLIFIRWWYMGRKQAWWRFAPCDLYGQPQALPFA